MMTRKAFEYIHEGRLVAEVDVTLIGDDSAWGPYLSLDDANKLDDAREALRSGDLKAAAALGRVYEMLPVAAE